MADNKERPRKPLPHPLSKEQRAQDAALAMKEYQAEEKAAREKTARLRELRLAREAAAAAAPKAATQKQSKAGKSSKS